MRELISGDPVFISWAEAMLAAEGIKTVRIPASTSPPRTFPQLIPDMPMPVAMPQYRLVITESDYENARAILEAAQPT